LCGPRKFARAAICVCPLYEQSIRSKAGVNAMELKYMITGERVSAPRTLIQTYPQLSKFADPAEDPGPNAGPQLSLLV